jgi:cell division protein FtsN
LAQDDYYYEIQLTNKQLVFYFMAGASGLILSFLAGVMVGRGVDAAEAGNAPRPPAQEDRTLVEETPRPEATPDLRYARRLEGDRRDEGLESPAPAASTAPPTPEPTPLPTPSARPTATPRATPTPRPTPTARPTPTPRASPTPRSTPPASPHPSPAASARAAGPAPAGTFSLQVGAFKERKAAESVVAQLKAKGFPAYVVTPDGAPNGLFNVRVGSYAERADAEAVQARLRDRKFAPFIVRN